MKRTSDDPIHRYHNERERVKGSDLSQQDKQAVLEFLSALDANNMETSYIDENGKQDTLAYTSLMDYGRGLRTIGSNLTTELTTADINQLRAVFTDMVDSVSDQTIRQRQSAARKFYRYHDFGVASDEIPLIPISTSTNVDERAVISKNDIEAIREACDNTRDRALVELLVYTGQRLRAIQTLRIKDIDLDESLYYLNTDEAGLKNADEVGGKRPLLGAEKPVRQWIENHPTGNDEDYLITTLPSAGGTKGPGEYLSKVGIYNRLDLLFNRANVDKPDGQMAHAFRHYFVTVCYRDYEMDPSTIKHLIGHSQESTVMETTYTHLTDQDHVEVAREARNIEQDNQSDDGDAFTRDVCPICKEPLAQGSKACPDCGAVFAPDAQAAKAKYQDQAEARIPEIRNDTEAEVVTNVLEDIRENPGDWMDN